MMGGEDAAGRDPGSAGKGLWAGGGGHLGGRGSFLARESLELFAVLLQVCVYCVFRLLNQPGTCDDQVARGGECISPA